MADQESSRPTRSSSGPESLGPYLNCVIWSLAALSGLFLGLRLFCKLWKRRQFWWDDYFLIASWISLAVSTSLQSVAVIYGLGMHYTDLDSQTIDKMSLFNLSAGFASILATTWSKTSFAISLLRISDGRTRIFIWFIIISVNLVMAANGTIQWVQCWPIHRGWTAGGDGQCWPKQIIKNYNTFVAAYSGTMDIFLALLPWKVIWATAINKREKLGALVAMSLGVFAGIMSFLKIKTLYVIGDDNETMVDLFVFGTAEPATAIMAASMPVLRLLFHQKTPKPAQFVELTDKGRAVAPRGKASDYDPSLMVQHLEGRNDFVTRGLDSSQV